MAEEKKPESNGLKDALPVTAVLAILAALLFSHGSPYHEERPPAHPIQARFAADAQDVDARLWQDPFAVVDGVDEEAPGEIVSLINSKGKSLGEIGAIRQAGNRLHTPDQIYEGKNLDPRDDITIIAVNLTGGPYQEDAELRMRWRYAVLSGLANLRAFPQDEQHIGYFHPKRDTGLQNKVPFEWWEFPHSQRKVLLLWVDESSLLGHPAEKLKELLSLATREKHPEELLFHYVVIGPNSSTVLQDMLKEVKPPKKCDPVNQLKDKTNACAAKNSLGEIKRCHPIIYYSAGATASEDERLKGDIVPKGKSVSEWLDDQGVKLYRTTATERELMKVLVDELRNRRVEIQDQVVILSEWDTFYGRVMPSVFKDAWNNDKTVQVFGYMRGLDGKLPDKNDKTGNSPEKKSDSQDKSNSVNLIELPEGPYQKDYLRRLADSIRTLDRDLKDKDKDIFNKKGVAAIGILGSDVHDKLLILEALRPHFPHKLFFTTDLDAAYSHPAKWPQTHNLLVASAFDLKLRDELQGEIPPFRDSNQTALFLATQLALQDEKVFDDQVHLNILEKALCSLFPSKKMVLNFKDSLADQIDMPTPRLFEIGRSQPVQLSTKQDKVIQANSEDSNAAKCSWENWPSCKNSVQPPILATSQLYWKWGGVRVEVIVVIVALLLSCVSWWVRERLKQFAIGIVIGVVIGVEIGVVVLLPLTYYLTGLFNITVLPETNWMWGGEMLMILLLVVRVVILFHFVKWWWRKWVVHYFVRLWWRKWVKQYKSYPYFPIIVGLVLFLAYCLTPFWNFYITQIDAEQFYWHEGVSAWPSQLLRLSAFLFAVGFFFWGSKRIQKMQNELTVQRGGKVQPTFALPGKSVKLERYKVSFVGSWKENEQDVMVFPDHLWKKYLGYCRNKKGIFPGTVWRVIMHGVAFIVVAFLLVVLSGFPDVPVRGCTALKWHYWMLGLAVLLTVFLTMWVVEHARLCERLIFHLSDKPSSWNKKARDWAIYDNKVAPECVNDWLDIQLVVKLTKTMQPLIWGPTVCLALLMLARSSVIDDWNYPWGLISVLSAMVLYAISAEVYLQLGAKMARKKAIEQLTDKIKVLRNWNNPDNAVIKRIEDEIERIRTLSEGAFQPWYQWPLLQAFGGLSAFVVALEQYFSWL